MRTVPAARFLVACLLSLLVLSSSCASEDEPAAVRRIGDHDGGDGDGDGDFTGNGDGDGDGDEDAGGDGDGDGDGDDSVGAGAFMFEVVPAVREADLLVPVDLSDDGHVLLLGDNGDNLFSMLFIWEGGTSEPRQIEVPDDYVVPARSSARLLTGDRIVLALFKSSQLVFAIIEDGEVRELMSPSGEPELKDANDAGQVVVAVGGATPRAWLLSIDEPPILIEAAGVTGITEAGIIGFMLSYWEDEELVDDPLDLGFFGHSGPSEQMTVLGFDGLPSDVGSPAAIWNIADKKVEPIADLKVAKELPDPILMLPNGDYVVEALHGSPKVAGQFLFHGGRYELLEVDDEIKLTTVAGNANGDLVATSNDEDYSAVIVRPQ